MIRMMRLRTILKSWDHLLVLSNTSVEQFTITFSLTFRKRAFKTLKCLSLIGRSTDRVSKTFWSNKAINFSVIKSNWTSSWARCTETFFLQQLTRRFSCLGSSSTILWCTNQASNGRTIKSNKLYSFSPHRWSRLGVALKAFRRTKVSIAWV